MERSPLRAFGCLVAAVLFLSACTGRSDRSSESEQGPPPARVQSLNVEDVTFDAVTLGWRTDSGSVDEIEVLRDGEVVASLPARADEFVDKEVTPGLRHVYQVVVLAGDQRSAPTTIRTRVPLPPLTEARLEGRYPKVKLVVLESSYGNPGQFPSADWRFTPKCESGPCGVILESLSGDYSVRLARMPNGSYRGLVIRKASECRGVPGESQHEFIVLAKKAAMTDGVWLVTAIKGTLEESGHNPPCLPAFEKEAFSGSLKT